MNICTSTSSGTCGSDSLLLHLNVICRMLADHLHWNDIDTVQAPLIVTSSVDNALVMAEIETS